VVEAADENVDDGGEAEDIDDETAPIEVVAATEGKSEAPKPAPTSTESPRVFGATALDKLLSRARESGIAVEDRTEAGSRKICVHITSAPDGPSRTIVRKLIAYGFKLVPGKGYQR
jgi:hypothetical protein